MPEAILSSKYQLVIPKKIRQETGLKTGEKNIQPSYIDNDPTIAITQILNIIKKNLKS